ncbi:MAG: UpxY family transcription antiterminator [Deltaproteobacteria bacterium]|nr:UpxY family transcription antiterminator [Deltaproteobacteria bacterium]
MTLKKNSRLWYVLHTKSRFENVVNDGLIKKKIEVFLPKIMVKSKRRDRKLMINVPLFPGYVFVQTDLNPHEHLEILKTAGAVRLLGNRDGSVPVSQEAIDSLKIMVSRNAQVITGNRFKKGDRVMVLYGPFAGVTGFFIRTRGQGRVVVNIKVLGQSAAVDVDKEDVEILPQNLL